MLPGEISPALWLFERPYLESYDSQSGSLTMEDVPKKNHSAFDHLNPDTIVLD